MKKITLILTLFIVLTGTTLRAQGIKIPAASTTQSIVQDFALNQIKLSYSRPNIKGRKIFGELIPYGQVWRTGANAPTKITFGEDILFEGQAVPAGEYALYTIPGKTEWTIILSKNTKLWGAMGYENKDDLLRVQVKARTLAQKQETFTIGFANVMPASCEIQLSWDKTLLPIKISADIDEKIMASIQTAMQGNNKPYFVAAGYYYDNDKDLKQALIWAEEAAKANPTAYWIAHLRAKILLKSGMKTEAIAAAQKSLEMAEKEKNPDYVKLNADLIKQAGKK